jgi:hypothetical protein
LGGDVVYFRQIGLKGSAMTATKAIIVTAIIGILVATGIMVGRWAAEQSRATEARWNEAARVLESR